MDKIDIVWKSYHEPEIINRGYWDQGLLEDTLKELPLEVVHHTDFDWIGETDGEGKLKYDTGAVVIINGRTHIDDTDKINADIAKLAWVLFIDTGDEEANFPWREISHPIMRVWMMLPRMTEHNDTHYKLMNGYRPETHNTLKEIGQQERTIDYSFIGQINHERRQQCFEVATQFLTVYPSSKVFKTEGFGSKQIVYGEYLEVMAKSKIVLCPSGIESPDNFRVYEALEAGCVPVVDAFSTNFKTAGFWRYLFGDDIPFPIVDYWDALPDMLPMLLKDFVPLSNKCFAWWQLQKRKLKWQLYDDIKELSK